MDTSRLSQAVEWSLRHPVFWVILSMTSALLAASFHVIRHRHSGYHKIPVVGSETDPDFRKALLTGRREYPYRAFALPSKPPIVILPDCMIHRLKSAPESQVSAHLEVFRRGLGQYTDLGMHMPELFASIKVDLTRHLREMVPLLQEEVQYAFDRHLPEQLLTAGDEDWHEITGFIFAKRVVTVLNALAFVGRRLCRDEGWQRAAYEYSSDLRAAFDALSRWPAWLRPVVHPWIFDRVGFTARRRDVARMLEPLLEEGQQEKDKGQNPTLLGYLRDRLGPTRGRDVKLMARMQLRAALASADTVSQVVANAILDIASRPEYVGPLREEIEQLTAEAEDGVWTMAMVRRMTLLDSFLKESARHTPGFLVAMGRITTAPLRLDDGTVVPKDTTVYFNMHHSYTSPDLQPGGNPMEFDGFRYSRAREEEQLPNKHLMATTGADHLLFGHGRDSCPGRFFAVTEIKVFLAYLLINYDLKMPGVEEGGAGKGRPKHSYSGLFCFMDRGAKVMIRRRRLVEC